MRLSALRYKTGVAGQFPMYAIVEDWDRSGAITLMSIQFRINALCWKPSRYPAANPVAVMLIKL
jgi:hypothetical protein